LTLPSLIIIADEPSRARACPSHPLAASIDNTTPPPHPVCLSVCLSVSIESHPPSLIESAGGAAGCYFILIHPVETAAVLEPYLPYTYTPVLK
jgi:hypothetical protein